MQFTEGAPVYSANHDEVGRMTRFVLDPTTKTVTHLVIRRGIILSTDHVIPFDRVERANVEGTFLHENIDNVQDLPRFEETYTVPIEYSGSGRGTTSTPTGMSEYQFAREPRYVKRTKRNIPDDSLALKAAARVVGEDKHTLGHIDTLEVDEPTGYISHLVIAQGLLKKTYRRVPILWCEFITENEVHIPVDTESFKEMPEYSGLEV